MSNRFRQRRALDFWPGFVDALSALLIVMIFVILIFVIGQFVLSDAVGNRDQALEKLHQEIAALSETLSLERSARTKAEKSNVTLRATLQQNTAHLQQTETALVQQNTANSALQQRLTTLREHQARWQTGLLSLNNQLRHQRNQLRQQQQYSETAKAQIELLNQQLSAVREQLSLLQELLEGAKKEVSKQKLEIDTLSEELNLALAQQVKELSQYRSEFFGRLRQALGAQDKIKIVGDRFVVPSEILFSSASAEVSEAGHKQLKHIAETLLNVSQKIPSDIPWILQVDGHTDRRPIATERYPSNWELSTARALAIVRLLRDNGVPPQRLAATGYGEFHPLINGNADDAYAQNRRIELKLTNR